MDQNKYLIELSESERTDLGRVDFASQQEPQKVFTAIWKLESHVNNGGFDSYFSYVDPASIVYASTALRAIKAVACAAIVDQAASLVFPAGIPSTHDACFEGVESLDADAQKQLTSIDQKFFLYPDDLTDLLFAFVESHPNDFGSISGH